MADIKIILKQVVSNQELTIFGEDEVTSLVLAAFANTVRDFILTKMEVNSKVVEIVAPLDYTLPSFEFSQQFGKEFSSTLVIMTEAELLQYRQDLCDACSMDALAEEAFTEWNCSSC